MPRNLGVTGSGGDPEFLNLLSGRGIQNVTFMDLK